MRRSDMAKTTQIMCLEDAYKMVYGEISDVKKASSELKNDETNKEDEKHS